MEQYSSLIVETIVYKDFLQVINRANDVCCGYISFHFLDTLNATTIAGQTGVAGAWSYQLSSPTSITFDQYFNMYIMDAGNDRIQRWRPDATFGETIASATMANPRGLAFDPSGNLATADYSYHRVVQYPISCREFMITRNIYFVVILNFSFSGHYDNHHSSPE